MYPPIFALSWSWLAGHPWSFLVIATVFGAILLFFDHSETWENVKAKKGRGRIGPMIKLAALWGLPLITVLSSIGVELGSEAQASQIADLETRQQPRKIADAQRVLFIQALKDVPKGIVDVEIYNQDAEITQYAGEIKDMLTDAGFDTEKMVGINMGASITPVGIFILVKGPNEQPPFAGPIQRAFKSIGIDAQGEIGPSSLGLDRIAVVVGQKSN